MNETVERNTRTSDYPYTWGLANEHGELVRVDIRTGEVTFGNQYTPNDAARAFWEAVHRHAPLRRAHDVADSNDLRKRARPPLTIDDLIAQLMLVRDLEPGNTRVGVRSENGSVTTSVCLSAPPVVVRQKNGSTYPALLILTVPDHDEPQIE